MIKICVIIPVYNEEGHLDMLLAGLRPLGLDVVVVDDGSDDGSAAVGKKNGVTVLLHAKNMGKGAAVKTGFDYFKKGDWDAALIMDGDGQHAAEDVQNFIKRYDSADILVGNRMGDARKMPLVRYVTNVVMSKIISFFAGQRIADTQCGFKLIKRDVILNLKLDTANFEFDSEILLDAAARRYTIASVPVKTIYGTERSKIRPIRDTILFIKLIIAGINAKLRRKKYP